MRDAGLDSTGVLQNAMTTTAALFGNDAQMKDAIRACMAHELSLGITSATDPAPTPAQGGGLPPNGGGRRAERAHQPDPGVR